MKKGYSGKNRKNYRRRRNIRKGVSAVLLVLMVLAFLGIRMRENSGTLNADGPEQTQEAALPGGTARESQASDPAAGGPASADGKAGGSASADGTAGGTASADGNAGGTASADGTSGETDSHTDASMGVTAQKPDERPADSSAGIFTLDMVPPYSGQAYADINDDVPFFTEEEMTAEAFHQYWPLDELGRCTGAYACVGPETLPKQKRGDISSVKPTGWNTNHYDDIDGEMLFNRCHLIGHLLTGQDANERNLITGTRYMNVEGMLPFEESVRMYVEGTGHHVMYRVRPYFDGDNLVCTGVLMEARSVEDPLVQFCAFCYNVQPGFEIDYATGDNWRADESQDEGVLRIVADPDVEEDAGARQAEEAADEVSSEPGAEVVTGTADDGRTSEDVKQVTYIINKNTHVFHMPYCDSVNDMKEKNKQETTLDRDSLIRQGYRACQRCHP